MEKKIKALLRLKMEHKGTTCFFGGSDGLYTVVEKDADLMNSAFRIPVAVTTTGKKYAVVTRNIVDSLLYNGMKRMLILNMW